jgi:hypothetical protein
MATTSASSATVTFDDLFARLDKGRLTANHYKLALFAGTSNLVTPKATVTAVRPAYIFFAVCGLLLAITYSFAQETRNKSMAEIEAMVSAPAGALGSGTGD